MGLETTDSEQLVLEIKPNVIGFDGLDVKKAIQNFDNSIAWIRSEPMALCQLFIQSESAYPCVDQFGRLGMLEFRDLNPNINAYQRKFVNELKRCDEMERQLIFFEKEISKVEMPILEYTEEPETPVARDMPKLETQFEKLESDLIAVNKNSDELKKNFLEFTELRYILKKTGQFFEEAQDHAPTRKEIRRISIVDPRLMRRFSSVNTNPTEMEIPLDPVTDINFIAGTILRQKFMAFEQMLWRVCKGNIFLRQVEIEERLEDPKTGDLQSKCIFIIVFQGEMLKSKCKKICEGFHSTLYPCPEKPSERNDMHAGVVNRLDDLQIVMKQTDEHRSRILVAVAKNLLEWKVRVKKMKSIYETMNLFNFDITSKCLVAECWCPTIYIPKIQEALIQGQKLSESQIPSVLTKMDTKETPPTLNITNKFTRGFQNIVDAYGVGNYGEVNPMPYTCVTFPFIFAVMFGDAGHGLLMFLFALWMVLKEKTLEKKNWGEIWTMFFNGRYIILLMGLFSIYTGFIYNDVFSKSMNIFGSSYRPPEHKCANCIFDDHSLTLDPQNDSSRDVYPFGMDPIWQLATNKILFLNTYKMKTSVILGVLQMLFGVMLSIINHIHFKKWINIFCEFIPQVLFLLAIFGYMDFMIIFKWFAYKSEGSNCAPSILITLINMFLMKSGGPDDPCYLKDPMFEAQPLVQNILLIITVVCIPWMLFIKPFYLRSKHKSKMSKSGNDLTANQQYPRNDIELTTNKSSFNNIEINEIKINVDSSKANKDLDKGQSSKSKDDENTGGSPAGHGGAHGEDGFNFGDIFINQAIHTIEYCLGSVSHTASYLRLWALSLAHSELSEVLWNMVFINGFLQLHEGGPFNPMNIATGAIMWAVFAAWAVLTISILLLMEGLSAFLHALRLHWVEFQSKFYDGSGYAFQPFSYKTIIWQMTQATVD